jgi:xanthine dehydrogenase accessory factor
MNERQAVLDAWHQAEAGLNEGVLCTVVEVSGSTYRRPGARMLIFPDGRRIGSVSGGCLESDLIQKGWWLTADRRPVLRVYDTMSDEDAVWEFGLGCNGVVHVLLERADSDCVRHTMKFAEECRSRRVSGAIATVIRSAPESGASAGDRLLWRDGHAFGGRLARTPVARELRPWLELAQHERRSQHVHLDTADIFIEWMEPPVELFLFGAGHDAVPLVSMAKELGWEVTVVDGRPAYACHKRFPKADRVVLFKAHDDVSKLGVTADSVVVMMTHNHPLDERLLKDLYPIRPRYLGLLGPRKRSERLSRDLGINLNLPAIHTPTGLDIGAEEPASIALSIIAEIQAVLAGRSGSKLRSRPGPIHLCSSDGAEQADAREFKPAVLARGAGG